MFKTITIDGNDYSCKLSAKSCVIIENKLNTNPLNVFANMETNELPKLGDLLTIFWGSLQDLNHGITMDKTYTLFDKYCEEGGTITSLIVFLAEVFKESGFMESNEKNT